MKVQFALGAVLALASLVSAQRLGHSGGPELDYYFHESDDGSIVVADARGTQVFESFRAYVGSAFFRNHGLRCGSDRLPRFLGAGPSDCNGTSTTISPAYAPSGSSALVDIPVVFHVITRNNGTGNVTDAAIVSQIQVLNEDFRALAGSLGAGGTDTRIQFHLATSDPDGNPTSGITRSANTTWYNDGGSYWTALAWDTRRYLNVYTNSAAGNLGYSYVPSGGGVVGNSFDRVVVYGPTVGRPAPLGAPYDLGRTVTHEVGHYLGLEHTFQGGCTNLANCYVNGDLICDTPPEAGPNFFPCARSTCGDPDPTANYMDYSDDACMDEFTPEQANRMRCTLVNFRVDLGRFASQATNPKPADGSPAVPRNADLAWSAGPGATAHDVYFGAQDPPPLVRAGHAGTAFVLPPLAAGTRYWWRIDEVNALGTTTGATWSFRTRR